MVLVRAIYQDGTLQLLDQVQLQDGQEIHIHIVEKDTSIRDLIGDMLVDVTSTPQTDIIDDDAIMTDLDTALSGKRPLSEIIIEERQEGR